MGFGEARATLKGTYHNGVALNRRTERSDRRKMKSAKECGQLENRTGGTAGSRGVRLSTKPERDDGEWYGSNT
jgi:hypothetical protein